MRFKFLLSFKWLYCDFLENNISSETIEYDIPTIVEQFIILKCCHPHHSIIVNFVLLKSDSFSLSRLGIPFTISSKSRLFSLASNHSIIHPRLPWTSTQIRPKLWSMILPQTSDGLVPQNNRPPRDRCTKNQPREDVAAYKRWHPSVATFALSSLLPHASGATSGAA